MLAPGSVLHTSDDEQEEPAPEHAAPAAPPPLLEDPELLLDDPDPLLLAPEPDPASPLALPEPEPLPLPPEEEPLLALLDPDPPLELPELEPLPLPEEVPPLLPSEAEPLPLAALAEPAPLLPIDPDSRLTTSEPASLVAEGTDAPPHPSIDIAKRSLQACNPGLQRILNLNTEGGAWSTASVVHSDIPRRASSLASPSASHAGSLFARLLGAFLFFLGDGAQGRRLGREGTAALAERLDRRCYRVDSFPR